MVDQASMSGRNANGSAKFTDDAPEGVVGSLTEFGNDVATLIELQTRLAVLDLKESSAKAKVPSGMTVLAIALALAALPVALLGAADLLATAMDWTPGASRLVVALVAVVVAGVLGYLGIKGLSSSFQSFQRTREELTRNISWIRTVIVHSGRSLPRGRW